MGYGRPRGARYSVSSTCSLPSRSRATRARAPNTPLRSSCGRPVSSVSDTLAKPRTSVKKVTDRSRLPTVMPMLSTDAAGDGLAPFASPTATNATRKLQAVADLRHRIRRTLARAHAETFQQTIADAQRVRHDRERWVDRTTRRKE